MPELSTPEEQRRPVATLVDLNTLDDAEILEGYRDGLDDFPCSGNRSRSYWHGWQNGMRDKHRLEPTAESAALAREAIENMRQKRHA